MVLKINTETMKDGNDDEVLSRHAGNNRQRSIHCGGTTYADRCQFTEISRQQRSG